LDKNSLAPDICRKSLDVIGSKIIDENIKKISKKWSDNGLNLTQFFSVIKDDLMDEINFKSMVVFYNNDLENRTYKIKEGSVYKNENCQFEKIELYSKLDSLSELVFDAIWSLKDTDSFIEFIRFYYYLDNKFFIELLTLIIVSFPDKIFNDLLGKNEEFLNLRRSLLQDEFLLREIRTIRRIFGC